MFLVTATGFIFLNIHVAVMKQHHHPPLCITPSLGPDCCISHSVTGTGGIRRLPSLKCIRLNMQEKIWIKEKEKEATQPCWFSPDSFMCGNGLTFTKISSINKASWQQFRRVTSVSCLLISVKYLFVLHLFFFFWEKEKNTLICLINCNGNYCKSKTKPTPPTHNKAWQNSCSR